MCTVELRALNDAFRKDPFRLGKLLMTRGIIEMPDGFAAKALKAVQGFDDFDDGNDPWGKHAFIAVDVEGRKVFARIDYYKASDRTMCIRSDDPADPAKTLRVLTVMLAEEY